MDRLRRFWALPESDRRLILQLVPLVAMARISLWMVPFSTLARWWNRPVSGKPLLPAPEWARLVRQASSVVPAASCLTQSLVLQWVLHRHACPSLLYIGVRQGPTGFAAHAWVQVGSEVVLGGPDVSDYSVLATVVPAPPAV